LYRETDATNLFDLWALPMSGDKTPIPIATTQFNELEGQFSPDVRWVAYTSNLSGDFEVYVQPFGRPDGRKPISNGGGTQPRWQSLDAETPSPLFRSRLSYGAYAETPKQQYAVSHDGQRFLMVVSPEDATPSPITVLLNWKPKL
jgi:Tol biopolymer transport system component